MPAVQLIVSCCCWFVFHKNDLPILVLIRILRLAGHAVLVIECRAHGYSVCEAREQRRGENRHN